MESWTVAGGLREKSLDKEKKAQQIFSLISRRIEFLNEK